MQLIIIIVSAVFSLNIHAEKHELFSGVAKVNNKVVYLENHDVTLDDSGNPLSAVTIYTDVNGKILGTLTSDFRKSLSSPGHVFIDERTHNKYGVRRLDHKIEMFNHESNKLEETKAISDQEDLSRVQIGCQGFNYFLKGQIENIIKSKTLPVLFMVPGELSTYKFVLEFVRENADQIFEFKVKIESWVLRLFAPELQFRYDRKIHRIVWYKGLSNLKDERGEKQTVEIDYKF